MKTNFILGLFVFFLCHLSMAQSTTISYSPSTADIANPERGIYHYTETRSGSYTSLSVAGLQGFRTTENVTLIYRIFYLEDFVSSPISNSFLANMQADFNAIRSAGLKCILRFAYTDQSNGWPPSSPYGDATKAWMLSHIAQLEPYLIANSDIIAVANAGFIGIWGEWYYTTYFGDPNAGPLTAANYADRKEVLDRLLAALPSSRMVMVRTPFYKYKLYNSGSMVPLSSAQAFTGTSLSRIGHHNDCFLASSEDYGTYQNTSVEYPYLNSETNYVPMGGETCALNAPRTDCNGDALNELSNFHWSFINRDYINTVWDGWIAQGCSTQIKKSLGYRFQLNSGTFSTTVKPGGSLNLNLTLTNTGWASPFNARLVEVILKNTSDGKICRARLPVDPRFWLAGSNQTINSTIGIPANFPNGTYNVYLSFPDPEASLYENPSYSIQLANSNTTWDATSGYNYLGFDLTVNSGFSSADYNGSLWFDMCYGSLPINWIAFNASYNEGKNLLRWKVNQDEKNEYFQVERSKDGIHFETVQKIQVIDHSINSYSFTDGFGVKGTVYYRIAQFDADGSFSYSPIQACAIPGQVMVSPNPFLEETTIDLSREDFSTIQLELLDLAGNTILKENYSLVKEIKLGKGIKPGAYIVRVVLDNGSFCLPLLKRE